MTGLHRWLQRAARWVLVPRDPAYRRPRCPSRVPAPVHRSPAANICTLTWGINSGRAARCRTLTTMPIAAATRKSTPRRTPARSTRSILRYSFSLCLSLSLPPPHSLSARTELSLLLSLLCCHSCCSPYFPERFAPCRSTPPTHAFHDEKSSQSSCYD